MAGRKPNLSSTKRLQIVIDRVTEQRLINLALYGPKGSTPSEVAATLLREYLDDCGDQLVKDYQAVIGIISAEKLDVGVVTDQSDEEA